MTLAVELTQREVMMAELDREFEPWRVAFQDLSAYFLPRAYPWIARNKTPTAARPGSSKMLTSAQTDALRTLVHGMFNGTTPAARPWLKLGLAGFPVEFDEYDPAIQEYFEKCARIVHIVLQNSNFYSAKFIHDLDLSLFGSAALLVYDDFDSIVRFVNSPVGEFRFALSARREVDVFPRRFMMTVRQLVQEFGLEKCSDAVQTMYKQGKAQLLTNVEIFHMIEPNTESEFLPLAKSFKYREIYWEASEKTKILRLAGYREKPFSGTTWEVTGNDAYGTSPAWTALPDVKQLQVEVKIYSTALDKMVRPPLVADMRMKGDPTALLPGGISYVPPTSTIGVRPVFVAQPPVTELMNQQIQLIDRIRRVFFNHLFRNVSDLQTVRTATEIMERKAEDMILLGAVVERMHSTLNTIVRRVLAILERKKLLPPRPPGLEPDAVEVQYISVLAEAQRSAVTSSIERWLQTVGEMAALFPEITQVIDPVFSLRDYAARLHVPARYMLGNDVIEEKKAAQQEQLDLQQGALVGGELTKAAKNLSETEIGGGQQALQALMGG